MRGLNLFVMLKLKSKHEIGNTAIDSFKNEKEIF